MEGGGGRVVGERGRVGREGVGQGGGVECADEHGAGGGRGENRVGAKGACKGVGGGEEGGGGGGREDGGGQDGRRSSGDRRWGLKTEDGK